MGVTATYNTNVSKERRLWPIPRGAALALALGLAFCAIKVSAARAHIGPAAVRAVLAMEGGEPTILLLNEGLSLKKGDAWHYVCPALWGDFEVLAADLLPDGTIMIGGDRAVWLFQADGSATVHPAPTATGGSTLALEASRDYLMQLRLAAGLTELLRIGPDQADIVWQDATPWATMAVGPDFVVVLGVWDKKLQVLRLATDGSELSRESVDGPPTGILPTARVVGSTVYYTVQHLLESGGYGVEAALIESGVWRPLYTGVSFIGPATGPTGELVAGIDGQLSSFEGYEPQPLPLEYVINCVDDFEGFVYVCDSIGLRELSEKGPEPPLFELANLQAPELDNVPEENRMLCEQQWAVYQQDLMWIGSKVPVPGADAGVPMAPDGGTAGPDAGGTPAATDGGGGGGSGEPAPKSGKSSSGGCSCHLAARSHTGGWGAALLPLMALSLSRRRHGRK